MTPLIRSLCAVLMLGAAVVATARADAPIQPRTDLPAYKQECAACHMAYPAGLLPAQSWKKIMEALPKHYGTDASIDDATLLASIANWLQANGGTYRRATEITASSRITDSAWFVRKHHEVSNDVWKRASIKNASNCIACHSGAEHGNFDEHAVQIPKK